MTPGAEGFLDHSTQVLTIELAQQQKPPNTAQDPIP